MASEWHAAGRTAVAPGNATNEATGCIIRVLLGEIRHEPLKTACRLFAGRDVLPKLLCWRYFGRLGDTEDDREATQIILTAAAAFKSQNTYRWRSVPIPIVRSLALVNLADVDWQRVAAVLSEIASSD